MSKHYKTRKPQRHNNTQIYKDENLLDESLLDVTFVCVK